MLFILPVKILQWCQLKSRNAAEKSNREMLWFTNHINPMTNCHTQAITAANKANSVLGTLKRTTFIDKKAIEKSSQ